MRESGSMFPWLTAMPWNDFAGFQWREFRAVPRVSGLPVKRSSTVVLVLSGALLSGCGRAAPADVGLIDPADTNTYTNNTYLPSQGYYHAAYHAWYPMPYGHFVPGRGYYYGGAFQDTAHSYPALSASSPAQSPKAQSAPSRSAASGSSAAESATTSRGGFGSSAHSTTSS